MELLVTWLFVCLVIGMPAAATHSWLERRKCDDDRVKLAAPLVATGVAGYAAFFAYFAHPLLGHFLSVSILVAGCGYVLWHRGQRLLARQAAPLAVPALLMLGVGIFYLALLYLPDLGGEAETQSQARFLNEFPIDANLPKMLGDRLYAGESAKPFLPDPGWLSSDRPPLQAGLYLLARPWSDFFHLPAGLVYQCVGTLAQLFWIPATWLAAGLLGLSRFRSALAVVIIAASGFALFNSTFVWPKLLAGAFVLISALLLFDRSPGKSAGIPALAASAAALGWLGDGAVAFSLAPLGLLLLIPRAFPGWKNCVVAVAVFSGLALPWIAYQEIYDTPANRLVKWHLAGVAAIDSRTTWEAIHDSYAALTPAQVLAGKRANFHTLTSGSAWSSLNVFTGRLMDRKVEEATYVFRSLGVLNLAWVLAPISWLIRRRGPDRFGLHAALAAWTLLTMAFWAVVLFPPLATTVQSSSFAMMLSLFLLATVWLLGLPRWLGIPILSWHAFSFAITWLPYYRSTPLYPAMFVLMAAAVLMVALVLRRARDEAASKRLPLLAHGRRWLESLAPSDGAYPWRAALVTFAVVLEILFLRRPEAFIHPQFWAEDGSVFFLQAEFMGKSALTLSYGGYHNLIPRLFAAAAAGLDPLWMPAAFFWSSIAVVGAVTFALFSNRLPLQHRSLLALALVLVPHTGEAFHALTNVQWVSALGLVLLLVARDPRRGGEWAIDITVAILVGLTGIFSLLFAPIFLVRAYARRTKAAWLIAGVVMIAAATQSVAFIHSNLVASASSNLPSAFVRVLSLRTWGTLLLPSGIAAAAPTAGLCLLAVLATAALWRGAKEQRMTKMMLWASALAVLAGAAYKFRTESALLTEVANGDRYFFLPKVLLLWLLILEWDSPKRWLVRTACGLALFASLANFRFTPFINYHWPDWARRIRAGERVIVPINPEDSTFTYPGR